MILSTKVDLKPVVLQRVNILLHIQIKVQTTDMAMLMVFWKLWSLKLVRILNTMALTTKKEIQNPQSNYLKASPSLKLLSIAVKQQMQHSQAAKILSTTARLKDALPDKSGFYLSLLSPPLG